MREVSHRGPERLPQELRLSLRVFVNTKTKVAVLAFAHCPVVILNVVREEAYSPTTTIISSWDIHHDRSY